VTSLNLMYRGSVENTEALAELTPETIGRWLAQRPGSGVTGARNSRGGVDRGRLPRDPGPRAPVDAQRQSAALDPPPFGDGNIVEVPYAWDGVAGWVAGPTREMHNDLAHAPIVMRASWCGRLELTVTAPWSLWDEGTADWATCATPGGRCSATAGAHTTWVRRSPSWRGSQVMGACSEGSYGEVLGDPSDAPRVVLAAPAASRRPVGKSPGQILEPAGPVRTTSPRILGAIHGRCCPFRTHDTVDHAHRQKSTQ
jgi:hypothetical protein